MARGLFCFPITLSVRPSVGLCSGSLPVIISFHAPIRELVVTDCFLRKHRISKAGSGKASPRYQRIEAIFVLSFLPRLCVEINFIGIAWNKNVGSNIVT